MVTVGDIIGSIRMRDEASAVLAKNEAAVKSFGAAAQGAEKMLGGMGGGLLSLVKQGAVFAGGMAVANAVLGAFSGGAEAVINMNRTLEDSTLQFEKLMGSATLAEAHVAELFEFARVTPYETGDIIQASRQLQTFGGSALNTIDNIRLFGDAAAVTGSNLGNLSFWVGRAYSMIKGGQPFGEAAMRLQELSVLTPETRRQMEGMAKAGKSSTEIWEVFTKSLEKNKGAMEAQSKTYTGLMSTLKDAVQMGFAKAFVAIFDGAKDLMAGLIAIMDSRPVQGLISALGTGLSAALTTIREVVNTLRPGFDALYQAFVAIYEQISGPGWGSFGKLLGDVLVKSAFEVASAMVAVGDALQRGIPYIQAWGDMASNRLGLLIDALKLIASLATLAFGPLVAFLYEALAPIASPLWEAFVNIFVAMELAFNNAVTMARQLMQAITGMADSSDEGAKRMAQMRTAGEAIGSVLGWVATKIKEATELIIAFQLKYAQLIAFMGGSTKKPPAAGPTSEPDDLYKQFAPKQKTYTDEEQAAQTSIKNNMQLLRDMAREQNNNAEAYKVRIREVEKFIKVSGLEGNELKVLQASLKVAGQWASEAATRQSTLSAEQDKAKKAAEALGKEITKLTQGFSGATAIKEYSKSLQAINAVTFANLKPEQLVHFHEALLKTTLTALELGQALPKAINAIDLSKLSPEQVVAFSEALYKTGTAAAEMGKQLPDKAFAALAAELERLSPEQLKAVNAQSMAFVETALRLKVAVPQHMFEQWSVGAEKLKVGLTLPPHIVTAYEAVAARLDKILDLSTQIHMQMLEMQEEETILNTPEQLRPAAQLLLEAKKAMEGLTRAEAAGADSATVWKAKEQLLKNLRIKLQDATQGVVGMERQIAEMLQLFPEMANLGPFLGQAIEPAAAAIEEAHSKTLDWSSSIQGLAGAFADFAEISGGAVDGLMGKIGRMVGLLQIGTQIGQQLGDVLTKQEGTGIFKDGKEIQQTTFDFKALAGDGIGKTTAAYTQLGMAAISAYGSMKKATDVKGRGNRAMAGAMTGASIGANPALVAATGGMSIAVGAAAGAIIGAARNPAWEDVMNRIGKEWGVTISEELAREIAANAKKVGGKQVAEALAFDKILTEGGGLKEDNVEKLTAKFRDLFALQGQGKITQKQLQETYNKSIGQFIGYVESQNEIASRSFTELIKLQKEFNIESEEMTAFLGRNMQNLSGSLRGLMGPLTKEYTRLPEQLQAINNQMAAIDKERDPLLGKNRKDGGANYTSAEWDKMNELDAAWDKLNAEKKALEDKIKGAPDKVGGEIDNLLTITLASINSARDAGMSMTQAVGSVLPELDELIVMYDQLGISSDNAAVAQLRTYRDIMKNQPEILASADALNQTAIFLSRQNGLNAESFAALEGQATTTYDRMIGAGLTEQQSLEAISGFLMSAIDAHEKLGLPIDENTQKLIDQANKYGLLEGKGASLAEILTDGFDDVVASLQAVAEGLGVTIPDAMKKIPKKINVDVVPKVGDNVTFNGTLEQERPVNMNIELDGRTIARVVAPHLAEEMNFQGV